MSFLGTVHRAIIAALIASVAFAATWWWTASAQTKRQAPGAKASDTYAYEASPVGMATRGPSAARSFEYVGVTSPADAVRVLYRLNQVALSRTEIRATDLADWLRFRSDHPQLALSTEMAVRWKINEPVPMREVASNCSESSSPAAFPDLVLNAEISIHGRTVAVGGWGCGPSDAKDADQFCECILDHIPNELSAAIPSDVADEDLAAYSGMITLRLWRL